MFHHGSDLINKVHEAEYGIPVDVGYIKNLLKPQTRDSVRELRELEHIRYPAQCFFSAYVCVADPASLHSVMYRGMKDDNVTPVYQVYVIGRSKKSNQDGNRLEITLIIGYEGRKSETEFGYRPIIQIGINEQVREISYGKNLWRGRRLWSIFTNMLSFLHLWGESVTERIPYKFPLSKRKYDVTITLSFDPKTPFEAQFLSKKIDVQNNKSENGSIDDLIKKILWVIDEVKEDYPYQRIVEALIPENT